MEEIKDLIDKLHPLERKILPLLDKFSYLKDLEGASGLKEVQVMRALQWLQNKAIIEIREDHKEVAYLDINGKKYIKEGLPEKKFLKLIKNKPLTITEINERGNFAKGEISVCMGALKKKAAIIITKERSEIAVKILDNGKKLLDTGMLEEQLLQKEFPLEVKSLKDEERFALENLRKRKNIVRVDIQKLKRAELTELGKKIIESGVQVGNFVDRLTRESIKDGSWKRKQFRSYDVKINVPNIFGGKKHHYKRFLDEVRIKFLSLGFREMFGPLIETDFWDMDALFMPQFHSARDIHAAYYIKEPKYGKLDESIVKKIKAAHENGYNTGSKGWQYEFDVKQTHRLLLRTQGTSLSARMLASKTLQVPGKYFAIARCFRPDVVDATHSADFNQVEGIVVEEGLDFRHLKGLLKLFAKEFAETDKIKITPAYFPFTEPSAELHAKHPELGWIELGGSGIFRPELVKPLVGREVPVLAWGIGIDRLAMFKLDIKDIRKLFAHDLKFLRTAKVI
jgi:phenylalanyl-tRNA synthetase alpha chain